MIFAIILKRFCLYHNIFARVRMEWRSTFSLRNSEVIVSGRNEVLQLELRNLSVLVWVRVLLRSPQEWFGELEERILFKATEHVVWLDLKMLMNVILSFDRSFVGIFYNHIINSKNFVNTFLRIIRYSIVQAIRSFNISEFVCFRNSNIVNSVEICNMCVSHRFLNRILLIDPLSPNWTWILSFRSSSHRIEAVRLFFRDRGFREWSDDRSSSAIKSIAVLKSELTLTVDSKCQRIMTF